MANTFKTYQAAPAATTETTLYTVPGATQAVISSIAICNRDPGIATFRVSVAVGGGATQTKDYLYYDLTLAGNDTFIFTIGITLQATDKVKVYASTALLSFNLFVQEMS